MTSEEILWPVPMKAIGAQNLLTMPGGVSKSGYLHKKGGTQFQLLKWPLRFVIIHKGCIYYFKSSTSAAPQGAFSLKGYNRIMRAAEETTSSNVFPFKLVHISKKHRTWFFSAASEDERKDWMASLRREINHFHEKKETVTDLSDSGSDADSFYGSIERPINIHYSQHLMENSDYDQDEDDYLHPDNSGGVKCEDHVISPPGYPPPPIPSPGKTFCPETKAHSFSGRCGVPVLPVPSLKKSLPDVRPDILLSRRAEFPFHCQAERDVKPHSTRQQITNLSPPVPPVPLAKKPTYLTESCSSSGVRLPLNCASLTAEESQRFKERKLSVQVPPPPLPSSKLKLPQYAVTPLANTQQVPKKPGVLTPKVPAKPQVPSEKPRVPVSKPQNPSPPHLDSASPRRSSPDGQSFRAATSEKPPLPSKSDLSGEESDGDYEKVELPNSVFVNTSESLEVERLFRSENPTGHPQNGLYCIRNSSTKSGKVLVVWDESIRKGRNYRIFQQDSKFYLESDVVFLSLGSLVEHYSSHVLPRHQTLVLQFPYGYSGPR